MGGFVIDFADATLRRQVVSSSPKLKTSHSILPHVVHHEQAGRSPSNGQEIAPVTQDRKADHPPAGNAPESSHEDASLAQNKTLPLEEKEPVSLLFGVANFRYVQDPQSSVAVSGQGSPCNAGVQDISKDQEPYLHEGASEILQLASQNPNGNTTGNLKLIDLNAILKCKSNFRYGPFWIYPKSFHLTGNYFNLTDVENAPQSPNGVILGQATYLGTMQQIESNSSFAVQRTRFIQDCQKLTRLQGSQWAVNARQLLSKNMV